MCSVLYFTPSDTFAATQIHIKAEALNAPATTPMEGLNTWLLSATLSQGPDLIAITTTTDFYRTSGEGCVGTSNFAVGSSNLGTEASNVVVTAHTGGATLPLTFDIYEMGVESGQIIGDNVIDTYEAGANKSILVAVHFSGCIPFDPVNNRIYIVFTEQSTGNILGGTSTAVSTNR